MAREHVIDPAVIHHQWDAGPGPPLATGSGDTVHVDIRGDLKIIEVVDAGVWTVAMTMPLEVFNGVVFNGGG